MLWPKFTHFRFISMYHCLQQEEVLSELFSYTKSDPPPADLDSTLCTLRYLESCNQIFEKGLLSHERVHKKDTSVIQNIEQVYGYFCDWLDNIFKCGMCS